MGPTLAKPDPSDERILERLRWLRQSNRVDEHREMGVQKPPFPLHSKRSHPSELDRRVLQLERELIRLRRQVDAGPGRKMARVARRGLNALRKKK